MSEPARFYAQTRTEWRAWLLAHHASAKGVWLVFNKKTSGKPHLSYDEQVEEALCFGWVDSKPGKVDAEHSSLYFAPRKSGSGWSRPNKERAERMLAQGLMTPAGWRVIEAAKRDGSWEKLDGVEALEIPQDLAQALDQYPHAPSNFEAFPRSVKRGILEWILQAKKPDTRAKRVEETAGLAQQNLRANQWRK
ncbi:MAG: YdeI/OmpD-associated family protein [Meiothermus sp.]|nr:YdeI/OmpD-associated family protein [Meiothermus sp.]